MNTLANAVVRLEPQVAAHAAEMFVVLGDPAIYAHENEPPPSAEWLRARFERLETRLSADGTQHWLNWVVRLPSGEPIGYVQATVHPSHRAAIAYVLNSRHWGQGLATAAVELMVAELVARYGVLGLSAVLKATNTRSQRLLERMGFARAPHALHEAFGVEADEWLMLRDAVVA